MKVEGGAARPIHITTNAPTAGPATPVYLYTQATLGDRKIESGITSVYSVSDAELADGTFKLQGNVAAIPVIDYSSQDVSAPDIHPMPVYILNPSTPTPPVVNQWWLSGGVDPANCVAAYQAKGVANYTASKVNLANPGTHDLTESTIAGITEPTWNASGWHFPFTVYPEIGSGLSTGLTNLDIPQIGFAICAKYSGLTLPYVGTQYDDIDPYKLWTGALVGGQFDNSINGAEFSLYIQYYESDSSYKIESFNHDFNSGTNNMYSSASIPTSGVIIRTGSNIYLDNTLIYGGPYGDPYTLNYPSIHIGVINLHFDNGIDEYDDPNFFFYGTIEAVSFYNANLTVSQISAITTAMQAL